MEVEQHHAPARRRLALRLDEPPLDLIAARFGAPAHGWSVGGYGAIAEFQVDPGEPRVVLDAAGLTIRSLRGALRIERAGETSAFALVDESDSQRRPREIAFCLPAAEGLRAARTVVTELGPDDAAVDPQARGDVLFDMGVGLDNVDACVRIAREDTAALALLRSGCGLSLFDYANPVGPAMPALSPPRVLLSAVARIEVYQPIPAPGGVAPRGPHTHVLPSLLRERRAHAPGSPIPDGWLCGLSLYPDTKL